MCQCAEATAVSIGNKCQTVTVQDGLAIGVQGADGALLKEPHVVSVVTEKVVFGKEVDGGLVVQGAGHDAPGNGVTHLCRQVQQALRLQLEQALVAREPDVEHSLRTVKAKAGALSARHQECGHLSFSEENFAGLLPEFVAQVVCCNLERHGLQVFSNVVCKGGGGLFGVKGLQFFPVLALNVPFQICAGLAAQRFKAGGQLLLACCVQGVNNAHGWQYRKRKHL